MVRSDKRIRNHPAHSNRRISQTIPYIKGLQRDYQELFWWNKLAVYNQQVYYKVATTTERNSDWMRHLRYPIRDGKEYDH